MEIWNKIKEILADDRSRLIWFIRIVLVIFIVSWLFGRGNTIIHWIKAGREINRQEAQIEEYRRQIEEMDGSIGQRETDVDTLEKFAREQYGFAAPGEDVYIIK